MKNLKNKFYDKHYLYFSDLERAINLTLDEHNIKNPKARSLVSIPVGLYLIGKDTLGRTIEQIVIIGEKLFEYPDSYYQKKIERESRETKNNNQNPTAFYKKKP